MGKAVKLFSVLQALLCIKEMLHNVGFIFANTLVLSCQKTFRNFQVKMDNVELGVHSSVVHVVLNQLKEIIGRQYLTQAQPEPSSSFCI